MNRANAPSTPLTDASEWAGSLLGDANRISSAYAAWTEAREEDRQAALTIVGALDGLDRSFHLSCPLLREMRLWRPEALLKAGRPKDSRAALGVAEAQYGASWETRLQHGRIAYYAGELGDAAREFGEALILLPPSDRRPPQFDDIAHLWADALCLNGEHDRARDLVERLFAHRSNLRTGNMRALRQTVRSEADLERLAALLSPSISKLGARSRMALYHYSMACRELGRYREAEAVVRQRFITSAEIVGFGTRQSAPQAARANWAEDARVTLANLNAALTAARAPMFLVSGTLLGCVRENDILGHDKDVDVGVMEGPRLDKQAVHDAIVRSGCFSIKPYQTSALLRLQHASGVLVDVFWHREENGQIVHEGLKSRWFNTPFNLVERPFLNETFLIPENYDLYLTENYGEWRVPMTEFETFVDTPNMAITHEGEMMWYYYCKIFDYYFAGKFEQFSKVAQSILRARPGDRQVAQILESVRRMVA